MIRTPTSPQVIVGRYALYRQIGAGGMATVYFGRLLGPVGFSRAVAIKRLLPQFAHDPEFVTMFLDEARLAARLRHPNIVPTLDVVTTGGEVFLVMEYVQGESLAQLLRQAAAQGRSVPPRIAASIVSGALLGLHAAHEARDSRGRPLNLVHRDVSPHNILVGVDGTARLLDFGVAKANGRSQHMTREGRIKGKLGYMAPEHLAGEAVTRESDVYSAAVVLWEALAGRKLFTNTHDFLAFARSVKPPDIDPPSVHRPDVLPSMDGVVMRGLAWHRQERFATARDMAAALVKVVGPVSVLEVAEWVETVAGEKIHAREEEIQAFEAAVLSSPEDWSTESDHVTALAAAKLALHAGSERAQAPPGSSSPVPFEVSNETTDASTPIARSLGRLRRTRAAMNALTVAGLGLIAAATFVSTRALSHRPVPGWGRAVPLAAPAMPASPAADRPQTAPSVEPQTRSSPVIPPPSASAVPAGPPPVPVSALPVAPLHAPAHTAPAPDPRTRRWRPAARPPAKPANAPKPDASSSSTAAQPSLDAIGGRE
jgi:serine/threonine-protein kinase